MNYLQSLLDFLKDPYHTLEIFIGQYHALVYVLLAVVIFCETGLVVTPFLPGDSLLFAAGALAGAGLLNIWLVVIIIFTAAILGDNTNYFIGKFIGAKIVTAKSRLVKKEYIDQTHNFYEKHGGKTIIMARFVPIVRTFAPFVAGMGSMVYSRFITFCLLGTILWVSVCCSLGYFLGQKQIIKDNFSLVALGIIFISVLPMIVGFIRVKFFKKTA